MFAIGIRRDSDNIALVFYRVIFSFLGVCFCIERILCKSSFKKNNFVK